MLINLVLFNLNSEYYSNINTFITKTKKKVKTVFFSKKNLNSGLPQNLESWW